MKKILFNFEKKRRKRKIFKPFFKGICKKFKKLGLKVKFRIILSTFFTS